MRDIQNEPDNRFINIDKVGVKDIKYPIIVLDKKNKYQHTIANVNIYVDLPHHFKGTHMSRFIEILNEFHGEITMRTIPNILKKVKERLKAKTAHIEIKFPYFIEKQAPVSNSKGLMEYQSRFIASSNDYDDFILGVEVPVTSVCPCSKEISERGAHNQRCKVLVMVRFKEFVWIEDLIDVIESSASSPLYSILKREDEKFVTEYAYDHPVFVEDIVRNVSEKLLLDSNITWFSVETESFESIHNHSAYANIVRKKD